MDKVVADGVSYTSKYITDKELAVIEAMRQGGQVEVTFFRSTIESALNMLELTPFGVFNKRRIRDLTSDKKPSFISVEMMIDDFNSIKHYVTTERGTVNG